MTVETLTSGSSWTCPADVTSVDVECWAAGGGGAGVTYYQCGGGGGGAYAKKLTISVTPSSSYSYQIGTAGAPDSDGTDSWFVNSSTVLAKAGLAGTTSAGGAGGSSGSCIGDTCYSGGSGVMPSGMGGGGGGGSASASGAGNSGSDQTGGSALTDGGAGGDGTTSMGVAGSDGTAPGGGGGGGHFSTSGGSGARGQIRLTYTVAASDDPSVPSDAFGGFDVLTGMDC